MMSSLRSAMRPMGALMIGLMILTQTGCATMPAPASSVPEPPSDGTEAPDDGISGLPDMGRTFTIAVVVIGGYIVYKMMTRDRAEAEAAEAEGRTQSGFSVSPTGCRVVVQEDQRIPRRVGPTVQCGGSRVP